MSASITDSDAYQLDASLPSPHVSRTTKTTQPSGWRAFTVPGLFSRSKRELLREIEEAETSLESLISLFPLPPIINLADSPRPPTISQQTYKLYMDNLAELLTQLHSLPQKGADKKLRKRWASVVKRVEDARDSYTARFRSQQQVIRAIYLGERAKCLEEIRAAMECNASISLELAKTRRPANSGSASVKTTIRYLQTWEPTLQSLLSRLRELRHSDPTVQHNLSGALTKVKDTLQFCQEALRDCRAQEMRALVVQRLDSIRRELDSILLTLGEQEAAFDASAFQRTAPVFPAEDLEDYDLMDVNLETRFNRTSAYISVLERLMTQLAHVKPGDDDAELKTKHAELQVVLRDCVLRRFQLELGQLEEYIRPVVEAGHELLCTEHMQRTYEKYASMTEKLEVHRLAPDASNEADFNCYEFILGKFFEVVDVISEAEGGMTLVTQCGQLRATIQNALYAAEDHVGQKYESDGELELEVSDPEDY